MKYVDSGIDAEIIKAVTQMGFIDMTPIQEQAIPTLMQGRDIIGQAQTGTGKTAAFGIPLIQKMNLDNNHVQGIVLCPTRELAMQVTDELRRFAKYINGLKITPVFGGQDMQRQIQGIKSSKIVVGTPGRVMDHMRRRTLKLENINMVVLDEADEMLNMGFKEDIETILTDVPDDRQVALFSATMSKPILQITKQFQNNAEHIKTVKENLTIPLIKQYYFEIKSAEKEDLLCRLMDFHNPKRTLIFCKTKRGADSLAGSLKAKGYAAEPLHGDLNQSQRNNAMAQFRKGKAPILIATDVAARGIDVDDVEAVFNYDIPLEEEYYVHRIGRTGRAGRRGLAFTFVVGKERNKLRQIEEYCSMEIEKGELPSANTIFNIKADKILNKAFAVLKKEDLAKVKKLLSNRLEENDVTIENLAAALLQMQMGEDLKDITLHTGKRRDGRGERSNRRARSDRSERRGKSDKRDRSERSERGEKSDRRDRRDRNNSNKSKNPNFEFNFSKKDKKSKKGKKKTNNKYDD